MIPSASLIFSRDKLERASTKLCEHRSADDAKQNVKLNFWAAECMYREHYLCAIYVHKNRIILLNVFPTIIEHTDITSTQARYKQDMTTHTNINTYTHQSFHTII